jgi:hypothetical protein
MWTEVPTGTINGTNNLFTVATAPAGTNKCVVFLDGVAMYRVYTASLNTGIPYYYLASGGTVITLGSGTSVPVTGQEIFCLLHN